MNNITPKDAELPRKRFQGYELESLMSLCGALTLVNEMGNLEKRMKTIPYMGRDYGMLKSLTKRMLEKLLHTMPDEQLLHFRTNLKAFGVTCGIKNITFSGDREFGRWISSGSIGQLVGLFREHCSLCDLDYNGQVKCSLRKAFGEFPLDLPEHSTACPYFALWGGTWDDR